MTYAAWIFLVAAATVPLEVELLHAPPGTQVLVVADEPGEQLFLVQQEAATRVSDNRWRLDWPRPAARIEIRAPGIAPVQLDPACARFDLAEVPVPRWLQLEVKGPLGRPVENARVWLPPAGKIEGAAKSCWRPGLRAGHTDSAGRIGLPIWEAERTAVGVLAPGFAPFSLDVAGQTSVVAQLTQAPERRIRIAGIGNSGVKEVLVATGQLFPLGRSDANGELTAHLLEDCDLWFRVPSGERWMVSKNAWQGPLIQTFVGGGGAVAGSVTDSDAQEQLPGAEIELVTEDRQARFHSVTGSEGDFLLTAIPAGSYELWVTGAGREQKRLWVQVQEGRLVELPPIPLGEGGRLVGRIFSTAGNWLAGAEVYLWSSQDPRIGTLIADPSPQPAATTDDVGAFEIERLPLGVPFTVEIRKKGLAPLWVPSVAADGSENIWQLEEGASLTLEVLGPSGEPHPSALVEIGEAKIVLEKETGAGDLFGYSAEDGLLRFEGLPPGELGIRIDASNLMPWTARVELKHAESRSLTARLEPGASVEGTVLAPDGTPVEGARIALVPHEGAFDGAPATTTTANGMFRLSGLPFGAAIIRASHPQFSRISRTLQISSGSTYQLDLQFAAGLELRGRVRNPRGEPLDGCVVSLTEVQLIGTAKLTSGFSLPIATDGSFHFQGLQEKKYRLQVVESGKALLDMEVAVHQGTPVLDLVVE